MARTKKRGRKSRRVGASKLNPGSTLIKLIAVGAGYLLGDTLNSAIDKALPAPTVPTAGVKPSLMDSVVKYGPVVAAVGIGAMLLLKKGKPSLIKTGAGGILLGAGLKRAIAQFGRVSGYQATPVIGRRRMAGYQATPVIGTMPAALTGRPSQLEGFRVNGYSPVGSGSKVMGSINPVNAMRSMNSFGIGSSSGYLS
jgi:hypothetical protein